MVLNILQNKRNSANGHDYDFCNSFVLQILTVMCFTLQELETCEKAIKQTHRSHAFNVTRQGFLETLENYFI